MSDHAEKAEKETGRSVRTCPRCATEFEGPLCPLCYDFDPPERRPRRYGRPQAKP